MTESQETPITTDGEARPHRRIKSFVMRAGRMTEGQQRGLEQGGPLFILPLADSPVDYDQVFGRSAPRTLEIGFGMGHSLLEMAAASPEQDFIGVEVHRPGVGALLNGVLTQGLKNLRVYDCDAIEVLNRCVADNSLDRLMLFFPDPWHKSRHNKRRLIQPAFTPKAARVLKEGGTWRLATDWLEYAEQMVEVIDASPYFDRVEGQGLVGGDPGVQRLEGEDPLRAGVLQVRRDLGRQSSEAADRGEAGQVGGDQVEGRVEVAVDEGVALVAVEPLGEPHEALVAARLPRTDPLADLLRHGRGVGLDVELRAVREHRPVDGVQRPEVQPMRPSPEMRAVSGVQLNVPGWRRVRWRKACVRP